MKRITFAAPQVLPKSRVQELRIESTSINHASRSCFVYLRSPDGQQLRVELTGAALDAIEAEIAERVAEHRDLPSGGMLEDVPEPVPPAPPLDDPE